MNAPKNDNKGLVLFGILAVFSVVRFCYILDSGAPAVVLMPTVWLPAFAFPGIFYLMLREQGKTSEQVEEMRKNPGILGSDAFLPSLMAISLVIVLFLWLSAKPRTETNGISIRATRGMPTAPVASAPPRRARQETQAKSSIRGSSGEPLSPELLRWYERLVSQRSQLDLSNRLAVEAFNRDAEAYHAALREARLAGSAN